ncbi:unnamed protein product [Prunus armeniaca]
MLVINFNKVVLLIQHHPSILFRDPTAEHHFQEDLLGFARPGASCSSYYKLFFSLSLSLWGSSTCIISESGRNGLLTSIAYGLWRLWKCQNNLVFEGSTVHPAEAVELMIKQQTEFLQTREQGEGTTPFHGGGGDQRRTGTQHWSCPPMAFVKINCDGAWTSQTLRGGWGWVIGDAAGVFKGAGGAGGVRCGVATVAEAEALRVGLCAGVDQGWHRVVLESDSKLMIDMLKGGGCSDSRVEGIVHDIRISMRQLPTMVLCFVPRRTNNVAHLVAAFACETQGQHRLEKIDHTRGVLAKGPPMPKLVRGVNRAAGAVCGGRSRVEKIWRVEREKELQEPRG